MMKKEAKKNISLILASLAAHIVFFYTLAFYSDFIFYSELNRLLNHKIVDKTKDLSTQIQLVDLDKKQVVDQGKNSLNETPPKDSKYVSAKDQTVKKETKATKTGKFQNSISKASTASAQSAMQMITAEELMLKAGSNANDSLKGDLGLKGLTSSLNKNTIANRRRKQLKLVSANVNNKSVNASSPSQRDDHLEGVEDGHFTFLNTRRTKYFSFYSRIKGQLRSQWNPLIREEVSFIYSTKRSIANLGIKKTSIQITLDQDGYLEEVALLKTSGNKAIDTAAIQAIRLAAPFPNPPKGMLEKDKKIRIFWDFVLES